MAIPIAHLLVTTFVLLILHYFGSVARNYILARKTGLPIFFCPVNPANPIWIIFSAAFEPQLSHYLPSWVYSRIKVGIYGWEFRCRYEMNAKLGPVFVLVTPARNEVWVADPEIANEVLVRRRDFLQLEMATRIMSVFGPNITSSNDDEWQRHRRIVAPVLNERIMGAIWKESSAQARELLRSSIANQSGSGSEDETSTGNTQKESSSTVEGLRRIAINVLGSIAYGRSLTDGQKGKVISEGHLLTFKDALLAIVNNHILGVFVPANILSWRIMPTVVQKVGIAMTEFPKYAKELVAEERKSLDKQKNTCISALVKLQDDEKRQVATKPNRSTSFLLEEEITGNLFNFTIAGFDTTASVMAYAIIALALEPEWQDWIIEEIDVVGLRGDFPHDYKDCFPLLKRCLALMFETTRLYTPVLHITRCTRALQSLRGGIQIPANTTVLVAPSCIHVSPHLYGPDPLSFRPPRWLSGTDGTDTLVDPPKGTFLPWSGGPRYCPGAKMAQVEFVGVIMEVFSKWRVDVVTKKGETQAEARDSLRRIVENSQPKITLQVKKPSDVVLKWIRR